MDDRVRNELKKILNEYDSNRWNQPKFLKAILKDLCGQYKKEINSLVAALEIESVAKLQNYSNNITQKLLIKQLAKQLEDEYGLAETVAIWAVESWVIALESISIAKTIIVSQHESQHYQSINKAIADTPEGATILVRPGIYKESIVINKNIKLVGDGALSDIQILSTNSHCISMQTSYAEVHNLTLRGFGDYHAAYIPQGKLVLENCDLTASKKAIIFISGSNKTPSIHRCRIHNGNICGIWVTEQGLGLIEDCEIFANVTSGIDIEEESNPTIRRCQIHDHQFYGILVTEQGFGLIEDCEIFANGLNGININQESNPTIRRCQIHDHQRNGIWVYEQGLGLIEDCEIFANVTSGIAIQEESYPTVRHCQIHDNQEYGIEVTGQGLGLIEDCEIFANDSWGIDIGEESNPTILRCQIHDNHGGIGVTGQALSLIEDCEIFANRYGIGIQKESYPTIRRCKIYNGRSVGIWATGQGLGLIEDCEIFANAANMRIVDEDSNPTIRQFQVRNNLS